jgi:hypothetical protein
MQTPVVHYYPLKLPLDSARHAPRTGVDTTCFDSDAERTSTRALFLLHASPVGAVEAEPPRDGATLKCFELPPVALLLDATALILLFAHFLAGTLASQRRLNALFFSGFQVERVALDLFNYVFLLHLALETAQGIFEGFPLLQPNLRQTDTPPNPPGWTQYLLQEFQCKSSRIHEFQAILADLGAFFLTNERPRLSSAVRSV